MVDRTAAGMLLAVVALLAPAPALAAKDDRRIWDEYPLPKRSGAAAAPARAAPQTPPAKLATAPSDDVERLAVASLLALIAGGVAAMLVSLRWPRARIATGRAPAPRSPAAPARATAPRPPAAPARATADDLWVHDLAPPSAVETAPVATSEPSSPPDPERVWAAEICWHLVDGGAQFQVAAHPVEGDDAPVTLAASPALEWPPGRAVAVRALADAVRTLESALVAAGWEPLPRGDAWYAKRFAWQPGLRPDATPPARVRHRELYETEFARQVDRTARLRRTIGARVVERQVAGSARE
jgi:hypothetical protein